jgi:hypothetical protein
VFDPTALGLTANHPIYYTGSAFASMQAVTYALSGNRVVFETQAATNVALVAKGVVSQTANLTEWQNSGGTAVALISASGGALFRGTGGNPDTTLNVGNVRSYVGGGTTRWILDAGDAPSVTQLFVGGGNFSIFNVNDVLLSLSTNNANQTTERIGAFFGNYVAGQALTLFVRAPSLVGLVVKGAASQTANLQEWRNNSNAVVASVSSNGGMMATGSYNESTSTAGVHSGYVGTPRILFANGTTSQNWQVDNSGGTFRWFLPGTVHMALDQYGLEVKGYFVAGGGGIGGEAMAVFRNALSNKPGLLLNSDFSSASTAETIRSDKYSSTSTRRPVFGIDTQWADSTDATRKGRLVINAWDTAAREVLRAEANGSAPMLGFLGASAVARPTVTGSRGGNAALASLLTALASLGLLTDSTTA